MSFKICKINSLIGVESINGIAIPPGPPAGPPAGPPPVGPRPPPTLSFNTSSLTDNVLNEKILILETEIKKLNERIDKLIGISSVNQK